MDLTERRKQFLTQILKFHGKTKLPVHYVKIAELVGVSKWTAYGMLKGLEKQGYLQRDYTVHSGEPGRSQVVFAPTRQALDLFHQATGDVSRAEEWAAVRTQVLRLLGRLKHQSEGKVIQDILAGLPQIEARIAFCAHILALFIVSLERGIGQSGKALIKRAALQAANPQMGLTLFVGMVMGTGMKTATVGLSLEVIDMASRFIPELAALDTQQSQWLFEFLQEALAQSAE